MILICNINHMDQAKLLIHFKGLSKTSRFKWHGDVFAKGEWIKRHHGERVWPGKRKVMEQLLFHSIRGHQPIAKLYEIRACTEKRRGKTSGFLPPRSGLEIPPNLTRRHHFSSRLYFTKKIFVPIFSSRLYLTSNKNRLL